MAVAINSQEAGGLARRSPTSPLNWSFTNTAGTLLLVGVSATAISGPTVNVTYNGVAMTPVSGTPVVMSAVSSIYLYGLVNPALGANTVSVSVGGSFQANADILGAAISLIGQSSPALGTAATALDTSGTTATATVSLSTTAGSEIISWVASGSGVSSANSPTTLSALLNNSQNTAADCVALGDQGAGGTVTAAYTVLLDQWAIIAVEVFGAVVLPFKRNLAYLRR